MADALAALDIVEGMEEFLNPSSVESPEKTVKASPCVPRTGGRTSTRRKPINEESDSVQILSRAPRVTRKAKIDVDETPAIHSNRKTVASSSFRKMETPRNQKEEISGQKMYSRRSTRLLEKKMVELNLNDAEGIKPIDFGGSDKDVPNEVEENVKEDSDDLGLNQEGMSDDLMETDIEDLLDKKSGDLSENAREPEQTSEVLDETVNVLVSQENTVSLTPGMVEDVDDEVDDANKDDDGADSEGCAESDFLSGENLEKSLGLKEEIPEEGCDDSGYIDTTECLVSKNGEEGFTAEKDSGSDIMDVDDPLSEDLGKIEFDAAAEDQKQNVELQNQATIEVDDEANNENNDDDGSEGYAESDILLGETLEKSPDLKDDLVSDDLGVMDFDTTEYQKQTIELQNQATKEFDIISVNDLGSTLTGEDKSKEDEKETTLVTPNCEEESDQLVIESGNEFESTTTESSNTVDCPTVTVSHISSCSVIGENNVSDSFTPQGTTPLSRLTQLIDMALSTLAADPLPEQMSSNSDHVICPASVTPMKKSGNLMAENPSTLSLPSSDKTPGAEVPIDMASSTLAADPLPQQMSSSLLQLGSNSDSVICPASVTPTKKSASKAPTLSRKINDILDENKENIDNSSRKFHPTNEADAAAASLTKKSLRQLKRIVKEKMQVTDKKNIHEEKDTAKVGRPALQSLSENRLVASEPGNV